MVDYRFYTSTYGGTLPEPLFRSGVQQAEGIILSLLYPRQMGELTAVAQLAVQKAICAQVESGLDRPVANEKTEHQQTTLHPGLRHVHGMPISPVAMGLLRQAGLGTCWV